MSQDTNINNNLEILNEEVSNLQHSYLDLVNTIKASKIDLKNIIEEIYSTIASVSVGDTSIDTTLFLLKTPQTLTLSDINTIHDNLKTKSLIPVRDVKINGVSIVANSIANIELPKVDTELNGYSNNAISNAALVKALKELKIPTSSGESSSNVAFSGNLADMIEDNMHQTVTREEKIKWNALLELNLLTEESDPTVPAWAKEPRKPFYDYSEIANPPKNLSNFTNDLTFLPEDAIVNLINNAINNHNHDDSYAQIVHTHAQYISTNYFNTYMSTFEANVNSTIQLLEQAVSNKATVTIRGWS